MKEKCIVGYPDDFVLLSSSEWNRYVILGGSTYLPGQELDQMASRCPFQLQPSQHSVQLKTEISLLNLV